MVRVPRLLVALLLEVLPLLSLSLVVVRVAVERLLADESIPNEPDADWGSEVIGFSANVKALGIVNHSVWLTENGYMVTNILDTAKCFYIGPDAVSAFMDFMRANLPYEEQVNVTFAPGEATPE